MLKMAKKTISERIGMGKSKKKEADTEDHFELSRCNSYDFDTGTKDSDTVYFRERQVVPIDDIQKGMERFSFLLETCSPGSVPDPLLIAALLDLPKAPVVTRACYLLECAHFVHQCNRGQWPSWVKMNLPAYRPSKGQVLSTQPVQRRIQILQLQASKLFHQWAEVSFPDYGAYEIVFRRVLYDSFLDARHSY